MSATLTAAKSDLAAALERALAGRLPHSRVEGLRPLTAGASMETWSFDAVGPAQTLPLILRRRVAGAKRTDEGGLPLTLEALAISAAGGRGAPVAEVVHLAGAESELGEALVSLRMEGETLGRRIAAGEAFAAVRPGLARQAGRALAAIHGVPAHEVVALPALDAAGTLELWAEAYRRAGPPRPVLEAAIRWLSDRLPPPGPATLVHGDFRNGNLVVDPDAGLVAVLDWELAHRGSPAEDLGWICVNSWRFGETERRVGGFGDLEDLLAGYAEGGGTPPPLEDIRFWEALGSLRWAAMILSMLAPGDGLDPGRRLERAVIARRVSECEADLLALMEEAA